MKKLLLFLYSLVATAAMQAQIIHVPGDYPTIQQGINVAIPGDTVLVAEGIYYEQINFVGKKPLMVASQFLIDGDTSHISKTIIDGSQLTNLDSATVVYFISGEDTTSILCGFTIQEGKGTFWDVWQCLIGGGIYIDSSSATIRNNIIQNNILNDTLSTISTGCCGAGIASAYGYPGWTIIENNIVKNNSAFSKFDWIEGGGIYVYAANARINNNLVIGNQVINSGSTGVAAGAGMIVLGDNYFIEAGIKGNLIENNIAASSMAEGAGVTLSFIDVIFTNNIVRGNQNIYIPPVVEGGLHWGGGLGMEATAGNSVFADNVFSNNKSDGIGGGISIVTYVDSPELLIENTYFSGNEAVFGGAIAAMDSTCPVRLQNNIFSDNSSSSQGGAIWINRGNGSPSDHLTVSINNSFYNNKADTIGGAFYVFKDNPVLFNSIFWQDPDLSGNEIAVESGYAEIAFSDLDTNKILGDKIIGAGMINSDPLFSDTTLLTTEHWSPCVDKGVAQYTCMHGQTFQSPLNDILGNLRPIGNGYDMGAYEMEYWPVGVGKITNYELRIMNWPNPFTGSTTFSYVLREPSSVTLQIFNSFGQLVAEPVSSQQQKGEQKVMWNAGSLPAGMYYYQIQAGTIMGSGKMVKY